MRCFDSDLQAAIARGNGGWTPTYSFDHSHAHDYWHGGTDPTLPASSWCTRLPLPKHSCDFQQVIEHTFGRFKRQLHQDIYKYCAAHNTPTVPIAAMRTLCVAALKAVTAAETIKADVAKLPIALNIVGHDKGCMFQMVADGRLQTFEGRGGDWPPKERR